MEGFKEWISLFAYLLIWFFSFEIFDMYLKKYIDSQDNKLKIYILILIASSFIYKVYK